MPGCSMALAPRIIAAATKTLGISLRACGDEIILVGMVIGNFLSMVVWGAGLQLGAYTGMSAISVQKGHFLQHTNYVVRQPHTGGRGLARRR